VHSLLPPGMEPCARGSGWRTQPGLVFFEKITDEVCAWAGEAAGTGEAPLFAIGLDPGFRSEGGVWRLLAAGITDVLAWDGSDDLAHVISARLRRWSETTALMRSPEVQGRLVGQSKAWLGLLRQIVEVAHFTDDSVLITGESGTGKELIARAIHDLDSRSAKGRFVVVDSTTLSPELAGSELFGHERGAFTGALTAREGAFTLADGGTLFLDEIGELPLSLQTQLLRVLQERTYKRVGSNTWQRSTFRLVCATNRDLEAEVAKGGFRRDLYYRIAGWLCPTPPLRDRTEDILPLANHFLAQSDTKQLPPALDEPVRDYLLTREYPGNVRDLRLVVQRLGHRHTGPGPITAGDVPEADRPPSALPRALWLEQRLEDVTRQAIDLGVGLKELGQSVAESAIRVALEKERGNLQRAARRLGVTDRALQMRRATGRSK
jgi:transcriptional regulator with GAF, ATPase, and Fis domain